MCILQLLTYSGTAATSVLFVQFQKEAMFEFCHQHPEEMPADEARQYELLKHLLYDDEQEVIFCYVPKGELPLSAIINAGSHVVKRI